MSTKVCDALDGAQNALNRMKRAYERGTGCHLTKEMIASLGVTRVAEWWEQEDPRLPAEEGGNT